MNADDERLGQLVRLLRRRNALTQRALAVGSGIPREDVMRLEAGRAGELELDRIRRVLAMLGGRARLTAWYGGAAADRLLDERHAGIVERALALLVRRGWQVLAEVTFSEYGERGSIDLMAAYEDTKAIAVCEIKSAIGSLEETNRVLDVKERIAPKLAKQRFGWWPAHVGRLLVVPNEMTVRRTIARHELTMAATYPARSREVRAWLHRPDQALRAIWFISERAHATATRVETAGLAQRSPAATAVERRDRKPRTRSPPATFDAVCTLRRQATGQAEGRSNSSE